MMAYDEALGDRLRSCLKGRRDIVEKKMFGGIGFLLNANMLVGVWKEWLIVRVGPDHYDEALLESHVKEFDITGRPMKGWVLVDAAVPDDELSYWVEKAVSFAGALPSK
jgi:TfoX/Sxy family transcriptional regulator of competence genes